MNHCRLIMGLVIASLLLSIASVSGAGSTAQDASKKPVIFKAPSGYMPAELSGHTGNLLLDPKKPAGMFVAYPKDGQSMAEFSDEIKNMVGKMFLHDATNLTWSSAPLPAPQGVDGDTGSLMTTADNQMEVQLAFYNRSEGVAYGYFGMRHKKAKGDDAKFLDAQGSGVKAFDELLK